MDHSSDGTISPFIDSLANQNYWPAVAARFLSEGRFSAVVELCKENLSDSTGLLSGHILLARALYEAGQTESAAEQFYQVLALDPDNAVALKHLGDIAFKAGDDFTTISYYSRILELDPFCQGIKSGLKPKDAPTTLKVTLVHHSESVPPAVGPLRTIPFFTETMGDLYLTQGHARLAAEVFRTLYKRTPRPHLLEKLKQAEDKARDKEKWISEHATITN